MSKGSSGNSVGENREIIRGKSTHEILDILLEIKEQTEKYRREIEFLKRGTGWDLGMYMLSLDLYEAKRFANEVYWESEILGVIVNTAIEIRSLKKWNPKGLKFRFSCRECGENKYRICRNWDEFKIVNRKRRICRNCRHRIKREKEEKNWKNSQREQIVKENDEVVFLKTLPYQEYLKTTHWNNKRIETLKRAGYKCQLCGVRNTPLEAHHNTYKNLGNELPEDLISLCNSCHGKFHGIRS